MVYDALLCKRIIVNKSIKKCIHSFASVIYTLFLQSNRYLDENGMIINSIATQYSVAIYYKSKTS